MENAGKCHRVWHKFSSYIQRTFGKDLVKWRWQKLGDKKYKIRSFDQTEFSRRIVGYEVMRKIERWVERYCPEIKIIGCDDSVYAGSIILLIPHPQHGITVMFIPQCTSVQNQFFLYAGHFQNLTRELNKMKKNYPKNELL